GRRLRRGGGVAWRATLRPGRPGGAGPADLELGAHLAQRRLDAVERGDRIGGAALQVHDHERAVAVPGNQRGQARVVVGEGGRDARILRQDLERVEHPAREGGIAHPPLPPLPPPPPPPRPPPPPPPHHL